MDRDTRAKDDNGEAHRTDYAHSLRRPDCDHNYNGETGEGDSNTRQKNASSGSLVQRPPNGLGQTPDSGCKFCILPDHGNSIK
jgi:hypothetical protein